MNEQKPVSPAEERAHIEDLLSLGLISTKRGHEMLQALTPDSTGGLRHSIKKRKRPRHVI